MPAPLHGLCGAALCSDKPGCLRLNYQDGTALKRCASSYASYLCDVLNALVKYSGLEKLELTPRNIYRIMQECKATEATRHVIKNNFYSPTARQTAPKLEFDKEKFLDNRSTLPYMLGQLHAVHTHKQNLIPSYGAINYKGDDWANKDNLALFGLFYLATGAMAMPFLKKTSREGL